MLLVLNKDEDLFELLSDASKLMGEGVGAAHFIEAISMTQTHPLKEMLSKKIKNPRDLIGVLNVITLPEEASFLAKYQLELKKAFGIKDKKEQVSALENVLKNYYWVGNGYSGKKDLTVSDLLAKKEQLSNVKPKDF